MADQAANTASARWKSTFADYQQKLEALRATSTPGDQVVEVEHEMLEAQKQLLELPAPSIEALAQKLEVLFDGERGETEGSLQLLRTVGDARRLTLELLDLVSA